ncbi:MAG: ROK family protein [Proteobacteria bacterium]|nr:ROK family protein [Verrucomicrobiota bacterium]NBU09021.1 ROK family protein [Pseudomonadota bacterium]
MNINRGLPLPAPRVTPVLDPAFRPAVLATHAFRDAVRATGRAVPVTLALEQTDGSVFHHQTELAPAAHPLAAANFSHLERLAKFLLWQRGGWRFHFTGPAQLAAQLQAHFRDTATGRFDSNLIGERVYDHPIAVIACDAASLPPERANVQALGRHLDGCRIGFDLGGSDRKVAAVQDGKVVFSEETVWDPYFHPDPQYHFDGIMDSIRKAAAHLPRVDAIGASAAGVYVNNRVKVASLFRGVAPDVFNARVKDLFLEVQRAWNGVPFEVANDGEVTALAGSMSLGVNGVLGIAMGTSQAAGYVTPSGNITTWLSELAFAPVDYHPAAACDEWSGDYGVGAQYFSQQAVGRLLPASGIEPDTKLPLPEQLKLVQSLMKAGDPRARKIYETLGTYLGYAVAHYADYYDFRHLLILGRVTSGAGGDVIIAGAKAVLQTEFPDLAARLQFHVPDEQDKRHGQAVAAASLPRLR